MTLTVQMVVAGLDATLMNHKVVVLKVIYYLKTYLC